MAEIDGDCVCLVGSLASTAAALEIAARSSPLVEGQASTTAVLEISARSSLLVEPLVEQKPALVVAGFVSVLLEVNQTGQIRKKILPAVSRNFAINCNPRVKGGCAITYFGPPNSVTYWKLYGVGEDGFETDPKGRLRYEWVATDSHGRAVNYYLSPKDGGGCVERIVVVSPKNA